MFGHRRGRPEVSKNYMSATKLYMPNRWTKQQFYSFSSLKLSMPEIQVESTNRFRDEKITS